MINKIISWVMLVLNIIMIIFWMTDMNQSSWFFVFVYFLATAYINIKYIETLNN